MLSARLCLSTCALHLALAALTSCWAQVTDIQPRVCQPGTTARLAISGKGLDSLLRVITSCPKASIQVVSASHESAAFDLTLPEDAPLGPLGIWIATETAVSEPWMLVVDDLPNTARSNDNTTPAAAQPIQTQTCLSSVSRGSQSDFFRFQALSGQRITFEVLTQSIHSAMDPWVRLSTLDGRLIKSFDDQAVGPEVRFQHQFEQDGDYLLELVDSRYVAGGAYHLRVGDFPLLNALVPSVIQKGKTSTVHFLGGDAAASQSLSESRQIIVPETLLESKHTVSLRLSGSKSSAWMQQAVTHLPVVDLALEVPAASPESAATGGCTVPTAVSGHLKQPGKTDSLSIRGVPEHMFRFRSLTRSLGSPTLLKMQLFNSAGIKVAETTVTKDDEWSFDYKFPDEGLYELRMADLLGRTGPEFTYAVEIDRPASFSLAVKGDASRPTRFWMDEKQGCVAVPLTIQRASYDGEIELQITSDGLDAAEQSTGQALLNPVIPAQAKEATVYIHLADGWKKDSLSRIRLIGRARGAEGSASLVSDLSIQRAKQPFLIYPQAWTDGNLILAGKPATEPPFELADKSVRLARFVASQSLGLSFQRTNEAFKAPITVLAHRLPSGWSATFQGDKDNYQASLVRSDPSTQQANEIASIEVQAYAEHAGQGFLKTFQIPVHWYDPVDLQYQLPTRVVAGAIVPVQVQVRKNMPAERLMLAWDTGQVGHVGSSGKIEINADQSEATINLQLPPNLQSGEYRFPVSITGKFGEQEITFPAAPVLVQVEAAPQQISVYPESIQLMSGKDRRQLVVSGLDLGNVQRDFTAVAQFQVADPTIAEVQQGVVYPKADGQTQLIIRVGGHEKAVALQVQNQLHQPRTQFESEVLVALSQQGCNSGACHGSPSGKGMFRLSLRAFDPQLDELTLIREEFGRRINTVEPEQSLLLLKPLMKVGHGGGKQIHADDMAYRVLLQWIREGGKADPPETPRCVSLQVYPNERRQLSVAEGRQQLSVIAHFSDSSQRDVTHLCAYESSNQQVATVDKDGQVRAQGTGEVVVLVRFLEHIETVRLLCLDPAASFQWNSPAPSNFIDELVYQKLRSMQILPAEKCSDSEFLRRVYLDLVGVLPTVDQTRSFLGDSSADKRTKLIDALLDRSEYARFWALKWGDLLKLTQKQVGSDAVYKYHRWIEQAIAEDMPYDQFATQLITASGSTFANPPANFYKTSADVNECVETISQVFIGARLQCAKCHNHPFERWTQDNYYGLAAFFQRVARRETMRPGEVFIYTSDSGEVTQPRTGKQMKPWLPSQGEVDPPADIDRRQLFAQWLTQVDNPYFAKVGANRVWSHLFARGIIDPVDDFRDSNPGTNEPLLEALADDFKQNGYSVKHLLRTILNSNTYQASHRPHDSSQEDTLYFSHQQPRLLKAEQLLDALNHVTGISQVFGNLPADRRATQLPAPDLVKVDFLKVFGQPERSTVCACERGTESNLAMAIELFNGPLIHERLRDPKNRFRAALAGGASAEHVLDELYLAALCRLPSESERSAAVAHLQMRNNPVEAFEDLYWAIINTDEFLFQH